MIVDRLENWKIYFKGDTWKSIFDFLAGLRPDAEEKKYVLEENEIYAFVSSYETKTAEEAKLEAHLKFIDIQAPLQGGEGIEWFPTVGLEPVIQYDEAKDVIFYKRRMPVPARVDLQPGIFALLYPEDAHMPGLMIGSKQKVKKVVVKVSLSRVRE
jgi:YhcH/YjgK/YiaL family protein